MDTTAISVVSGSTYSAASAGGNSEITQLEKEKTNLEKELKEVKQSKGDAKTKAQKTQQLQNQIQQLEARIQQLKAEKSGQQNVGNKPTPPKADEKTGGKTASGVSGSVLDSLSSSTIDVKV